MQSAPQLPNTVDEQEVAKFSNMAEAWWDPNGEFKPLHKFTPVRLSYIKEKTCNHFKLVGPNSKLLQDLKILDIGCGGGLLSEPMARLGAKVVGVDPSHANIQVAKLHAEKMDLDINYQNSSAEELIQTGEKFDVVMNMEVVEHVADVEQFVFHCSALIKPGGLMFVSTINRTLKAYLLAIIGAERILRWLPKGTHKFDKFVKPEELEKLFANSGLLLEDKCGVVYNPILDCWKISTDLDVNYILLAKKPE